jgi:hypothetical protein
MRRWRALLLALAVATSVAALLGCSREDSRLESVPRPVLSRDLVLWSRMLGVDITQVDWRAADAALEAYSSELSVPRTRVAETLARALADAPPSKGSELESYRLEDDDALRRAANIAGQWHEQLRARDDSLFGSLAGVRGIGPDVAELMRQLRAIDRARMACSFAGGDLGPPDALGDALRDTVARDAVDPPAARQAVRDHAARSAAALDSLRRAVLEDSWQVAAAARDAHIAAQAQIDADPASGDADAANGDDGRQRAVSRTWEAITSARNEAQAVLRDATVTQLLDCEAAISAMAAGDGALADAAQRTLTRYAMLSDPARTDRNIRAARFLMLRDPDLDDATRRRCLVALDGLEQLSERLIVDAWRTSLENVRRQRAKQPELPVPDAGKVIGERATEWLASLPDKTRERLEGVARNWDVAEAVAEGFGADTARAFRESLGGDWEDRLRDPEPQPEWSAEGERPVIAELIILPPGPTPQRLRVAASIAGLDESQSAIFVEDSVESWRALLREQVGPVKAEQDAMEKFGASGTTRAARLSMARRYHDQGLVAPLRSAQAAMAAMREDLCARAAALAAGTPSDQAVRRWWDAALGPAYTDVQRMVVGEFTGPLLREADLRIAQLHPEVPTPEWTEALAKHAESMQGTAQMLADARISAYWRLIEAIVEAERLSDEGDSGGAEQLREESVARMNASLASIESIAARAQLDALESLCGAVPPREALRLRAAAARLSWPELSSGKGQARAIANAERIRDQLQESGAIAAAERVDEAIDRTLSVMWDVLRALPRAEVPALSRDTWRFDKLVRRYASLIGALESLDGTAVRAVRDAELAGHVPPRLLTATVLSPAPVPVTRPSS